MQHKKYLEHLIKQHNLTISQDRYLVLNETKEYIGLELGGHWISKWYTTRPTDLDYGRLLSIFFNFICGMACDNCPTYENK